MSEQTESDNALYWHAKYKLTHAMPEWAANQGTFTLEEIRKKLLHSLYSREMIQVVVSRLLAEGTMVYGLLMSDGQEIWEVDGVTPHQQVSEGTVFHSSGSMYVIPTDIKETLYAPSQSVLKAHATIPARPLFRERIFSLFQRKRHVHNG